MPGSFDKLFFHPIPEEYQEKFQSFSIKKNYDVDEILFMDGEKADELYLIHSGKVKINKTTLEGQEITLYICQENEMIGELALFQPNVTYTASARMIEKGTVSAIPRHSLEDLLTKDAKLAVEFMKWMGTIYRRNQSKFRDLMLFGKQGALYSTLIRMSNSYGKPVKDGIFIDLQITHREFANIIASTRESVNRALNELKNQNVISVTDGYITIHDIDYLREQIECDNCPDDICRL